MPKKQSYITVTDQFCGAGGSSQGAAAALARVGIADGIKLAMNHWKLAIETHNTNFPDTLHDCTDISACDPRRYPSTDILITSPECTNHSLAKGVKIAKKQMDLFNSGELDPAAERSRATMWDVVRFAEYHQYNAIIVENVVDARKWVMFDSWLHAMRSLNYEHKCVYLNSKHCHPTPQSRDRMYVVFWKKGNKAPDLDYKPFAYCPSCGKDVHAIQTWKRPDQRFGKYRQQYVYCCPTDGTKVEPYYFAAFNCIDWSNPGTRIGDRLKPLSPNTIARIEYGRKKYKDFPMLVNDQHSTGIECRVKSCAENIGTIPTTPHYKLVMPLIIKAEHSHQINVRHAGESLYGQTTRQSMALVVENKGTSFSRPITRELQACTTKGHHGIFTEPAVQAFIATYYSTGHSMNHYTESIGTVNTKDRHALISYTEQPAPLEDCYYRMLTSREVKLAMAFNRDYVVLGSSKDQVRQLGNAVTPPAMEWLVGQVIESLK